MMTKVKVKKATDDTKMQSAVFMLIFPISEEKIFDESSNEVDILKSHVCSATYRPLPQHPNQRGSHSGVYDKLQEWPQTVTNY